MEPADLAWRDGRPYSRSFGDIYHDADGTAEVERVFLQPAGFDALLAGPRPLVVGELGFGTGLNFAVVARRCLAAGVPLEFISFEAFPVAPDDFRDLARRRQAQEPVYRELAGRYPPLLPGWHRRLLYQGRIRLSVYYGDAEDGLADLIRQIRRPVDLWLLDGFAPDRNPGMWGPSLLAGIGRTATRGTRVATFTAAGRVRRSLAGAGFEMRRVDQRPRKRESLAGAFREDGLPRRPLPERVTVVGAGIAGAAIARELAEAGIAVTVLERDNVPASGASAVPATLMHPRLHHQETPAAALRAVAYAHALAAVAPFLEDPASGVTRPGILQLPSANYPADRLQAVAERYRRTGLGVELLSGGEAAERAGLPAAALAGPALWFAQACLVDTPRFTRTLLDHEGIHVRTGVQGAAWPAGTTVLACGHAARTFPGAGFLEVTGLHGQLDRVRIGAGALRALRVPLVGGGYLTPLPGSAAPPEAGVFAVGATYEHAPWPEARATRANLRHLEALADGGWTPLSAVRAERCVSSDRSPIVGPLYDLEERASPEKLVSVGHGSMGAVTAHLGAALIAGRLLLGLEPLAPAVRVLISPRRFRRRQARRGYRFGASP